MIELISKNNCVEPLIKNKWTQHVNQKDEKEYSKQFPQIKKKRKKNVTEKKKKKVIENLLN